MSEIRLKLIEEVDSLGHFHRVVNAETGEIIAGVSCAKVELQPGHRKVLTIMVDDWDHELSTKEARARTK